MGQSLAMTPQLQQAIKLLHLSALDLENEIQSTLESNPLLERQDEYNDHSPQLSSEKHSIGTDLVEQKNEESLLTNSSDTLKNQTIENDMISDTRWEDWGYTHQTGMNQTNNGKEKDTEYLNTTSESLREQLLWQVTMSSMTELDRTIAMILIDSIDESGFMKANLSDVCEMLNQKQLSSSESNEETFITVLEVESVLHYIQSFEPSGIGARHLQESLLIQLNRIHNQTEQGIFKQNIERTQAILKNYFPLLASRNYHQLKKQSKLSKTQLQDVLICIKKLNPRPGNQLSENTAQYIKPDVYVKKDKNKAWSVQLNPELNHKLNINQTYASLIKRADNSHDNCFIKENLQNAKWFIKSLNGRNETLLKVTRSIIEKQTLFLEKGEEGMKPLILHDIAQEVGMHESTISRITTQKFMHTPKGIFELKYFFSSHVSTHLGGECSSTAIKAMIKKLLHHESTFKPLSDNKIAILLQKEGINVARRTVAKYRESMAIPPSNERKSL
jgi:RNA polymerase sigma-54 factor